MKIFGDLHVFFFRGTPPQKTDLKNQQKAEALKLEGNTFFKKKDYNNALAKYKVGYINYTLPFCREWLSVFYAYL